ncbi:hypothetical protein VCHA29O37_90091 [Vibrio chagasii]|nr:hypothetical protein VCHA29O37_90091 [Vibrio chagasii]
MTYSKPYRASTVPTFKSLILNNLSIFHILVRVYDYIYTPKVNTPVS